MEFSFSEGQYIMSITNELFQEFFNGNLEVVEKRLNIVLKRRKNDPWLWFLKALISKMKGLNKEALSAVENSINLKKDFYEALVLKGIILRELKFYEEAIKLFNEALKVRVDGDNYMDYEVEIEKAKTYIAIGNKNKAKQIINKILEINPEDDDIKSLLQKIK